MTEAFASILSSANNSYLPHELFEVLNYLLFLFAMLCVLQKSE